MSDNQQTNKRTNANLLFEALMYYQWHLSFDLCDSIFLSTNRNSETIWESFDLKHNRNMLTFYNSLSIDYQDRLISYYCDNY